MMNKIKNSLLNEILIWDDSHKTLREICLSVILHLYFTWSESFLSEKSRLHTFLGFHTFVHVTSQLDILSNATKHP